MSKRARSRIETENLESSRKAEMAFVVEVAPQPHRNAVLERQYVCTAQTELFLENVTWT
jgi:hypothetical protein